MDGTQQPKVLLAATLWWPLSARLATRFLEHGCDVSAICPRGHLLGHVPGIRRLHPYSVFASRDSLEAALVAAAPDLVVPCDDRVVWQLHELHALRPGLRPLIEASLGRASDFGIVAQRDRLLETAAGLGVKVPETILVRSVQDVRAWFAGGPSPSVMKVDGTWGGSGVQMVDSEAAGLVAHAKLSRRAGLGTAVKRLVVNSDPLAFWGWRKPETPPITIQRFIEGRPANMMIACWRGETLASVTVEVLSSQGKTGAGIVARLVQNQEIARAGRLLAERLGLTGFYGLDFVIDGASGAPYLIEMNPRCTQLGHLSLPAQGDLAGILRAKLPGSGRVTSPPLRSDVIAFFPQAMLADPPSRYARDAHLDVPWEYPALVRELMRPLPPARRALSRLYHALRPPRTVPTVDFAEGDAADRLVASRGVGPRASSG